MGGNLKTRRTFKQWLQQSGEDMILTWTKDDERKNKPETEKNGYGLRNRLRMEVEREENELTIYDWLNEKMVWTVKLSARRKAGNKQRNTKFDVRCV